MTDPDNSWLLDLYPERFNPGQQSMRPEAELQLSDYLRDALDRERRKKAARPHAPIAPSARVERINVYPDGV